MNNYYVMLHDEKKCIGCQACTVSCANSNNVPDGFSKVQVQIKNTDNGRYRFYRVSCQHCENAPCVSVCPTGASYVDDNGIVRVNENKCIACNYCMKTCHYHVRFLDPSTNSVDKCDFCVSSRLEKGEQPMCVTVCPTDALRFGKADSAEVKKWLQDYQADVYQEEKDGAGKAHVIRRKQVHAGGVK